MVDTMASILAVNDEPGKMMPSVEKEARQGPHPTFGPHPNTLVANFNLKKKKNSIFLSSNLGDVPLEKEHQAISINLIYSNQEVFSLHDEDLGYCD